MESTILTVHLLLALALILVVLLQRSEGGGLGIGGGGGGIMSGRSAATALSKVTWALGIAFVVTSLSLTILAARKDATSSVVDRLGTEAPATEGSPGLAPGLEGDLLPPIPEQSPATPTAEGPAAPPPIE